MKFSVFIQSLLAVLVLVSAMYIRYREKNDTVEVFSGSPAVNANLTFSDLAELLYEKSTEKEAER